MFRKMNAAAKEDEEALRAGKPAMAKLRMLQVGCGTGFVGASWMLTWACCRR